MKALLLLLTLFSPMVAAWCPLLPNHPVRVTINHAEQKRQADAYIRTLAVDALRLQLVAADTGYDLSGLDLSAAGIQGAIQARPLAEDTNLDGAADHFWLVTSTGEVWRVPWQQSQFGQPLLMADLSDARLHFHSAVTLIRARLPSQLAPMSWRNLEQHQLLLLGTEPESGQDVLFSLRFPVAGRQPYVMKSSQLVDRTTLSDAELRQQYSAADWRVLLSAAGWRLRLSGRVSSLPTVIAGVIYAPAITVKDAKSCQFDKTEQQLYAVQLYTASQIYPKRSWAIPYLEQAALRIREQPDKRLILVLADERQSVALVDTLLKITTDCHQCTAPLTLDKFPLWQRLATYRDERGAF